jgi:hypothetical protein
VQPPLGRQTDRQTKPHKHTHTHHKQPADPARLVQYTKNMSKEVVQTPLGRQADTHTHTHTHVRTHTPPPRAHTHDMRERERERERCAYPRKGERCSVRASGVFPLRCRGAVLRRRPPEAAATRGRRLGGSPNWSLNSTGGRADGRISAAI